MSLRDAVYGDALSAREAQVGDGIVAGKSMKEIARDLGVNWRTVEQYRTRAFKKTGARNGPDFVRIILTERFDRELGKSGAAT